MSNQSEPFSVPPAIQRVAFALRTTGWVCFWVQLVLAVVSALILLFAIPFALPTAAAGARTNNPGTGGGLLFTIGGLALLGYSIYRAFRYTRLARQLRSAAAVRPKKADTAQDVRFALISNTAGMLLTILGAETISGILLAKSLSQPRAFYNPTIDFTQFIQPLDIFIVLANTHMIFAHFIGMAGALWLLDRIYKQ